jgi:hypothetical protein
MHASTYHTLLYCLVLSTPQFGSENHCRPEAPAHVADGFDVGFGVYAATKDAQHMASLQFGIVLLRRIDS